MNYNIDATTAATTGLLGGLMAFLGIIILITLAIVIFTIIAQWKVFEKGKQPGWAALIPFYNQYVLCKMVGVSPWWILIVFFAGILSIIPVIGGLLSFAVTIYFAILLNVSLARAFGKENSFAVGLILLSPVFYAILGFGKDEYKGANPMNDVVMNKLNKNSNSNNMNNNNNSTVNPSSDATSSNVGTLDTKFCTNCGAQIPDGARFCTSCGTEVK